MRKLLWAIPLLFIGSGCGIMRPHATAQTTANTAETSSANSTVNSADGLVAVTASVSKLAEQVTGLRVKIDKLETTLEAQGTAVAGWRNDVKSIKETVKASAGRDVNMWPRTAVDTLVGSTENWAKTLIAAISTLCTLITGLAVIMARNSRKRAELRAQTEREERQSLMHALQPKIPNPPAS